MTDRIKVGTLRIEKILHDFVTNEALPNTGISAQTFWNGLETLLEELAPENRFLLAKRGQLQEQLNHWHKAHRGPIQDHVSYRSFLEEIGYVIQRVKISPLKRPT